MKHLSNDHKNHPNHNKNSHKMERGIHFWFEGKSIETDTWSEFLNGRKATVEQILRSEELTNQEKQNCGSHSWDPNRKVNNITTFITSIYHYQVLYW